MPDVGRDPRGWFRLVDLNGDGHLDQKEVVEVLKAALPIDWKVRQTIPTTHSSIVHVMSLCRLEGPRAQATRVLGQMGTLSFPQSTYEHTHTCVHWPSVACVSVQDRDGNGTIEMNEMMDPQNGLVAYVRRTLPHRGEARPPDLKTHRLDWFRYWDEDNNGTLEQEVRSRREEGCVRVVGMDRSCWVCVWRVCVCRRWSVRWSRRFECTRTFSGCTTAATWSWRCGMTSMQMETVRRTDSRRDPPHTHIHALLVPVLTDAFRSHRGPGVLQGGRWPSRHHHR